MADEIDNRHIEARLLDMLERLETNTLSDADKADILMLGTGFRYTHPTSDDDQFMIRCLFMGWYILSNQQS